MACLNCGHHWVGAYCSRCGQRARRSRFALRPLLREAADEAFNFDRGLLHTVIALSRAPGRAIAEYVRGRTRPYTNPAKYLVVWTAVAVFLYVYSGVLDAQVEMLGEAPSPQAREARGAVVDLMNRYFNVFMILAIPFLAAFSYLFFRGAAYNFAEHLIFNVFVYAHLNVLAIVLLPIFLVSGSAALYLSLWTLLIVMYYVWACKDFFAVSRKTAIVRGVLVTACGSVAYWILTSAILLILVLG